MNRTSKEFLSQYHSIDRNYSLSYEEREAIQHQMLLDWWNELEVGDHAHICHYSDVSPVTVIKRTAKTITVRYDKADLDPNWKPEWITGGFSAHCTNNSEQRWIITEDPDGRTDVFRLRKTGWRNTAGEKLLPEWKKHYDYNF